MIDTILMFCALVVAIQIIRYLWNWTTGILSGREERERLERENKTLTYQVKNLEAKLTLFDRIGVIPLDKNRVNFASRFLTW